MKIFSYHLIFILLLVGLAGCQSRSVIVQQQYPQSEGLISVKNDREKWGFVNKQGLIVIPLRYDYAMPFSEGLSAVQKNGKWGYINWRGETIIPFKYSHAERYDDFQFQDGWAIVDYEDNIYLIDRYGNLE